MRKRYRHLAAILVGIMLMATGCQQLPSDTGMNINLYEEDSTEESDTEVIDDVNSEKSTENSTAATEQDIEGTTEETTEDAYVSPYRRDVELAVEALEKVLPDMETALEDLSTEMSIYNYCVGDIGNDGTEDIAVILSGFVSEQWRYPICVFTKQEDGAYKCTEINYFLIHVRAEGEFSSDCNYEIIIADGALIVLDEIRGIETKSYQYVFVKEADALVVEQISEERTYAQSGNGESVIYDMKKGKAQAFATTTKEAGLNMRVLYDATFEIENVLFEDAGKSAIPEIAESDKQYWSGGSGYDYHAIEVPNTGMRFYDAPWKDVYLQIVLERVEQYPDEQFDLIYLNEDEIPELVVGVKGYYVLVYSYEPGAQTEGWNDVACLMEKWSYGAGGNSGYEYISKGNVIRNYNSDYGGLLMYTSYWGVNENAELELIYNIHYAYEDAEGNILLTEDDENELNKENIRYYYMEEPVTEAEFETYKIDGDFKMIDATTQYAHVIVDNLCQ